MNHLSEEQLVLHYYGEPVDRPVDEHLAGCEACREEYRRLAAPAEYGGLRRRSRNGRRSMARRYGSESRRRCAAGAGSPGSARASGCWPAAMAGLLVAAFLAGRITQRLSPHQVATAKSAAARTGPAGGGGRSPGTVADDPGGAGEFRVARHRLRAAGSGGPGGIESSLPADGGQRGRHHYGQPAGGSGAGAAGNRQQPDGNVARANCASCKRKSRSEEFWSK